MCRRGSRHVRLFAEASSKQFIGMLGDVAAAAVVIGEYERAFYGSQYALMAPLFEH